MYKFSDEALEDLVNTGRKLVAQGELPESALAVLKDLEEGLLGHGQEDWDNYNFFFEHFPTDDADHAMLVLKGQLLIERLVRDFIAERLPNSEALRNAQFTANHCITLGEAFCLPGPRPAQLWRRIRKLNKLRNTLAHELEPEGLADRIIDFLVEFNSIRPDPGGSIGERLGAAIRFLYGELLGLVSTSREEEFRIPKAP
jgi:hypothetical protein